MKTRLLKNILAIGISLCFLAVSTSLTGSMAGHAVTHDHSKESHAQSWCDWMCKASHAIQTPFVFLEGRYHLIASAFIPFTNQIFLLLTFSPGARSPPHDLFS